MSFLKKKGFAFCVGVGTIFSAAFSMLLLLLTTFLIFRKVVGQEAEAIVSYLCAGCGVLGASVVVTRAHGRQALLMGAALSGAVLLLFLMVHLCAGGSLALGGWFLWLAAAVFCGGLLGALISAGKGMSGKRKHKRRRG